MPHLTSPIVIEVCVDSVRSARNAVRGGASRLEICGNLGVGGGTTPSLGLLKAIQKSVGPDVPTMAMIRPRTGDFLYSNDEVEVMLEDIRVFKRHGVQGVVLGALKADGRVDIDVTKRLVDEALPLQVCFHRAFDMTRHADEALRDVMRIGGISRILTSGHGPQVGDPESLKTLESLCQTIQKLAEDLPWVLSILPGSGINSKTVGPILDALLPLGLMEIHLSGGSWVQSGMVHRQAGLGMGVGESEWGVWETSEAKVRDVRQFADAIWAEYASSADLV
ncbi:copper homeostasis CutC domain-containing protein [Mycena latifolia]|nr:copper homeostasis CutC domain-containing protein [Mycena latifolia]